MAFQTSVRLDQGFGIPGEILFDGPLRAQPCQIDPAAVAANCIVGSMFSQVVASGLAVPGSGGAAIVQGTNKLLGLLATPKNYALQGTTAGGPLASTLLVQPGIIGEFVEMGLICAVLQNGTAKPGDSVEYHMTTGLLQSVRGAADANYALIPNATIDRVSLSAPGLVLIKMTGLP